MVFDTAGIYSFIATDGALTSASPATFAITPAAVSVTVTNASPTAVPGQLTTFNITISNDGAYAANGVNVVDAIPAGLVAGTVNYFAMDNGLGAAGYTTAGAGGINDTVNLPAGASITYAITGTVDPAATGNLSDSASASTPTGVVNTEANIVGSATTAQASASVALTPQATFSVAITGSDPLTVGGMDIYTIIVTNNGPSNETGVIVQDTFPFLTDVTYSSAVLTAAGTVTGNSSSSAPSSSLTLSETLTMTAGAIVQYTIIGTVAAGASGTLSDSVTVSLAGVNQPATGDTTHSVSALIVDGPSGSVVRQEPLLPRQLLRRIEHRRLQLRLTSTPSPPTKCR